MLEIIVTLAVTAAMFVFVGFYHKWKKEMEDEELGNKG